MAKHSVKIKKPKRVHKQGLDMYQKFIDEYAEQLKLRTKKKKSRKKKDSGDGCILLDLNKVPTEPFVPNERGRHKARRLLPDGVKYPCDHCVEAQFNVACPHAAACAAVMYHGYLLLCDLDKTKAEFLRKFKTNETSETSETGGPA